MKKKIIMIVACVMCCAGLFGGCGQSGMKQDNTAISNSEEGKQEGTTEEKEVTGTIDEIKDFMFVVTDKNGTSYGFTFEEKLYKLTSQLNSYLENKRLDLYIESITRFLYDELLANKMSEREALIYLKLISVVCPFTAQRLFEEIFEENYFLVYEEWPFLN